MRQNYKFNQRIIDKESDPRYVSPGKIIDATNCRVDDTGSMVNLRGNKIIASLLPESHVCIGAKKHKDWIYYFSTNDITERIGRYNTETSVSEVLNLSNANLNLRTNGYIDFIDFLDDEENGKLLMYWPDGINRPRYYDWLNPATYSFDAAFFSVLKAPPFYEPKIRCLIINDNNYGNGSVNNLRDKMFQFAYRYIYYDGSTSALSSRSRTAFYHNHETPDTDDSESNVLSNYFNAVEINLSLHSPIENLTNQVEKVEVYAIDINLGQAYLINTIDNSGSLLEYKFDFRNSSTYPLLSSAEYGMLMDSVPSIAKVQTLAEGRIFYANYTDGKDNNIIPHWGVNIKASSPFEFYKDFPGEYNLSVATDDGEEITVTGPITKGTILYFVIFMKDFVTNKRITGLNLMLVAEETYASLRSFVESPVSRIGEILDSKKFLWSVIDSDTIAISGLYTGDPSGAVFYGRVQIHKIPNHTFISLRRGSVFDYALCYFDEFGIPGGLIEKKNVQSPMETYFNPVYATTPYRVANVTISHTAPSWAKKFKLYRREKKYSTVILDSPNTKYLLDEIYIEIPESVNPEIPDTASYIELIATKEYPFSYVSTNIVSCRIKRVEITDETSPNGAGRWIVIGDQRRSGYDGASANSSDTAVNLYKSRVFEITTGDTITDEAYKEIPGVYEIDDNGYHLLDAGTVESAYNQSQYGDYFPGSTNTSFHKRLDYDGDVMYGYDTGSMYKIMSYSSNGNMFSQLGRPQVVLDSYRELSRKFSVTYSGKYNYETGDNGLSTFNIGLINYNDYPREYGAIKCLFYRDTDIVVFQEDKVIMQPYNKNIIESIGGGKTLTASASVLPQFTAYAGEYGMSHHESLAFRDRQLFWVDVKRGVFLRLSQDGIFPISNFGMRTYFKNLLENL